MGKEHQSLASLLDHIDPSAEALRERAEEADVRAFAAERDRDFEDAGKWRREALELRRRARAKEFAGKRSS